MKSFPLFISATGKKILVFGGGRDAAAKLRLVLKTEAHVLLIAEQLDSHEIQPGAATFIQANPLVVDLPGDVAFAYAATGDKTLDAKIARRLRAHKVLVCAADQPDVSDFSTPAIVDRDPVVVAIGTEGTAPVLSRSIKARVEALLSPNLGHVARVASSLRPLVADHVGEGLARRTFWRKFFEAAPVSQAGAERVAKDLISAVPSNEGFLSLVGTGPGDPELLTLKARKVLDRADVVFHDLNVASAILELARREAVLIPFTCRQHDTALDVATARKLRASYLADGQHVAWLEPQAPDDRSGQADEIIPGIAADATTWSPLQIPHLNSPLKEVHRHG